MSKSLSYTGYRGILDRVLFSEARKMKAFLIEQGRQTRNLGCRGIDGLSPLARDRRRLGRQVVLAARYREMVARKRYDERRYVQLQHGAILLSEYALNWEPCQCSHKYGLPLWLTFKYGALEWALEQQQQQHRTHHIGKKALNRERIDAYQPRIHK